MDAHDARPGAAAGDEQRLERVCERSSVAGPAREDGAKLRLRCLGNLPARSGHGVKGGHGGAVASDGEDVARVHRHAAHCAGGHRLCQCATTAHRRPRRIQPHKRHGWVA